MLHVYANLISRMPQTNVILKNLLCLINMHRCNYNKICIKHILIRLNNCLLSRIRG
jgi:hypothetical protein